MSFHNECHIVDVFTFNKLKCVFMFNSSNKAMRSLFEGLGALEFTIFPEGSIKINLGIP